MSAVTFVLCSHRAQFCPLKTRACLSGDVPCPKTASQQVHPLLIELFLFWQVQARAVRTSSRRCVTPLSHVARGRALLLTGPKAVAVIGCTGSRTSLLVWSTACLRRGPML